jgi:hypothetical protein
MIATACESDGVCQLRKAENLEGSRCPVSGERTAGSHRRPMCPPASTETPGIREMTPRQVFAWARACLSRRLR